MNKIKVANPVVELDGDEMTRIIWHLIREKLIHPYLDIDLDYYDLSIENRDATDDQVTVDAANAIKKYGRRRQMRDDHPRRGACRGIQSQGNVEIAERHDPQHPGRRHFPRADHLQECAAPRAGLDGADRRRPPCLRRSISRNRFQSARARAGSRIKFEGEDGKVIEKEVFNFPGAGVAHGDVQSRRFDPRFRPRLAELSASCANIRSISRPRTRSSRPTTAASRRSSRRVYEKEFKAQYQAARLTYEHRLIDDMVASALKWSGGYVWACKNYDGDVQSDTVAQGFGSLGLMTSVLLTPDGRRSRPRRRMAR